jgi:hypothetical protein
MAIFNSFVARGGQVRKELATKSARVLTRTRARLRRRKRLFLVSARRAWTNASMRLFRARLTASQFGGRALAQGNNGSATIVALVIFAVFIAIVQDTKDLKTSEVHLTCAQVIGAALALILSLSIIPAQRAAEAFSPAVLKLYAQDRWLLSAFLILAFTTTASVLLGTSFARIDPRIAIGIQFVLLGASFDAMRIFHGRALDLLIPQTAIRLVIRQCTKQLDRVSRVVERFVRIQNLAATQPAPADVSRWLVFTGSQISASLRFWTGQLDEIAHKLIARRDTSAVNEIISAMGAMGRQYAEARRNSLILVPDYDHPFAGGASDVQNVLNPIQECIRVICEDAAKSSNELVVKHCIETLAGMTAHAMTMLHSSYGGWQKAPLAFSPCFYVGLCAKTAIKHDMDDAVLAAVSAFQSILLSQRKDVNTSDLEAQCLESLFTLAIASYAKPNAVWGFPAMGAMLLAARHDIQLDGYRDSRTLKEVLGYARTLTPLEVATEKAGYRSLQVFPPYNLGFEASGPALFEMVAHQVKPDPDRSWTNPFHNFLKAAEDIRHHYRELADLDYDSPLLRKWIVDSLIAAARVHFNLLVHPPAGTEDHIEDVDEPLRWLVSWIPRYFSKRFDQLHANDAADALACLGIGLLEHDRIESARECGKAIAGIATNCAVLRPEPYAFADLQERLEVLARAADALDKKRAAVAFRAMIEKPATINDDDWKHFLEARATRLRQLDNSLEQRHDRFTLRDDPVGELQRIMLQSAASSSSPSAA